jgi:hypothetical protein
MRYFVFIALFMVASGGVFLSCKKYVDPAPQNDPRLTRPYCNDPEAVNYNWDFPGKPDNSTCFYPTDRFTGTYRLYDTVVRAADALYLSSDSFDIYFSPSSHSQTRVTGFCGGSGSLQLSVSRTLIASIDTTVGDSTTTAAGQQFCRSVDTVSGTITRDPLNNTILHVSFNVASDTGLTQHYGTAVKK